MSKCRSEKFLNRKTIFDNLTYNNGTLWPMDVDMIYDGDHKVWIIGEIKHEKNTQISRGAWICLNRLFDDLDSIPDRAVYMYHARMKEEDYPDLAKGIVMQYRDKTPNNSGENWEYCWKKDEKRTVREFMDDYVYLHNSYLKPYK